MPHYDVFEGDDVVDFVDEFLAFTSGLGALVLVGNHGGLRFRTSGDVFPEAALIDSQQYVHAFSSEVKYLGVQFYMATVSSEFATADRHLG